MSELILIDQQSGLEIGRSPMQAYERLAFYRDHMEHALLRFADKLYITHTVGWRIPEENFVASVTYHSDARLSCGCERGCCTCC